MRNYQLQDFSPIWARPDNFRLGGENSSLAQWAPIQPILKNIGELLGVEIAIIDTEYLCVAGTGPYEGARGFFVPKDTALGFSLQSQEWAMVLNPGTDDACLACSIKDRCRDRANYTGPLRFEGKLIGALQIVAFSHHQRIILLEKAEKSIRLICQLIEQFCEAGFIHCKKKIESLSAKDFVPSSAECRFKDIVGDSPSMHRLKDQILRASLSDSTVLISGESGTGKELIAKAIHRNSPRCKEPFIAINCGAIPETLIESELFGYSGGAFSGARVEGRKGLLKLADKGTIFFDEISDLPLNMQVKLLRFLQEYEILPIGGNQTIRLDVRVIAATNRNLFELVKKGSFRPDLYYRLNVIPLTVPPLRERLSDIPALSSYFINQFVTRTGKRFCFITKDLMQLFLSYSWPGNVRELKNFIEYGAQFCNGETITREIISHRFDSADMIDFSKPSEFEDGAVHISPADLTVARKKTEYQQAKRALLKFGYSVKGKKAAARHLGISLSTLYRILKRQ